jgi:hypothetical protein
MRPHVDGRPPTQTPSTRLHGGDVRREAAWQITRGRKVCTSLHTLRALPCRCRLSMCGISRCIRIFVVCDVAVSADCDYDMFSVLIPGPKNFKVKWIPFKKAHESEWQKLSEFQKWSHLVIKFCLGKANVVSASEVVNELSNAVNKKFLRDALMKMKKVKRISLRMCNAMSQIFVTTYCRLA